MNNLFSYLESNEITLTVDEIDITERINVKKNNRKQERNLKTEENRRMELARIMKENGRSIQNCQFHHFEECSFDFEIGFNFEIATIEELRKFHGIDCDSDFEIDFYHSCESDNDVFNQSEYDESLQFNYVPNKLFSDNLNNVLSNMFEKINNIKMYESFSLESQFDKFHSLEKLFIEIYGEEMFSNYFLNDFVYSVNSIGEELSEVLNALEKEKEMILMKKAKIALLDSLFQLAISMKKSMIMTIEINFHEYIRSLHLTEMYLGKKYNCRNPIFLSSK